MPGNIMQTSIQLNLRGENIYCTQKNIKYNNKCTRGNGGAVG